MEITVSEIMAEFHPLGVLTEFTGNGQVKLNGISPVESGRANDLVFVDKKEFLEHLKGARPGAVVTSPKLRGLIEEFGITVLVAPNVALAHALLKRKYADRDFSRSGWSGIHPSAVVHETARIDKTVIVEPKAVIGANVAIGKNCRIMAGAIIENDAVIGDETVIHPSVVVGYACRIGRQVVIGSGTVIGSEGYGFAQDSKRKSHPIPQTGIVLLEDRVRVGSNCSIDRATYAETKIGSGTKIDNLCHIAHNVQIGEDCLITAMFCIAGSSKIGNRVITSGQVGVLDHVNVCDDAILLHRAGVTKDVEKPGAYGGLPLQPLHEHMKSSATFKSGPELRRRLQALEDRIGTEHK